MAHCLVCKSILLDYDVGNVCSRCKQEAGIDADDEVKSLSVFRRKKVQCKHKKRVGALQRCTECGDIQ